MEPPIHRLLLNHPFQLRWLQEGHPDQRRTISRATQRHCHARQDLTVGRHGIGRELRCRLRFGSVHPEKSHSCLLQEAGGVHHCSTDLRRRERANHLHLQHRRQRGRPTIPRPEVQHNGRASRLQVLPNGRATHLPLLPAALLRHPVKGRALDGAPSRRIWFAQLLLEVECCDRAIAFRIVWIDTTYSRLATELHDIFDSADRVVMRLTHRATEAGALRSRPLRLSPDHGAAQSSAPHPDGDHLNSKVNALH
jgi:hypothetical protein